MKLFALLATVGTAVILSSFMVIDSSNAKATLSKHYNANALNIGTQEKTKMSAAAFKAQDYCRVELKDFEFDVQFKVVSATIYFTGNNFENVEKRMIKSTSLKPVKDLMQRCTPGSIVIFDDIKVMGPDNTIRPINGLTLLLY